MIDVLNIGVGNLMVGKNAVGIDFVSGSQIDRMRGRFILSNL